MENLITQAEKYKKEGNDFFREGDFKKARSKYSRVFAFTKTLMPSNSGEDAGMVDMAMKANNMGEIDESLKVKAKELERDVNCNLAMVYIKEKNWSKATEKATLSLAIEKTTKGYFRRGKAYAMKNDFENALKDFELGKELNPDNSKLFDDEIIKMKKREKEYDKKTSEKYAGFFSK